MQRTATRVTGGEQRYAFIRVRTTIYHVVEAVGEALNPGEEDLLPHVVGRILGAARAAPAE